MGYIKGTKEECEAYNALVNKHANWQGVTNNWDNPREVDGEYYITSEERTTKDTKKMALMSKALIIVEKKDYDIKRELDNKAKMIEFEKDNPIKTPIKEDPIKRK